MGHIELAAPVTHIWYFKIRPYGTYLNMSPRDRRVIYFASHIVIEPGDTPLEHNYYLNVNTVN